jgi:TorA maturation chaperone TorD
MSSTPSDLQFDPQFVEQFRRLVAADLRELAFLQEQEVTAETLQGLREVDFPNNLGLRIASDKGQQVCQFLHTAISSLGEAIAVEHAEIDTEDAGTADADGSSNPLHELAADFAAIYLNHTYRASPCESVWFDEDGLAYQEPMFQAREMYKRYGLAADNWRRRSEDHLVMQLLFVAHLMDIGDRGALQDAVTFLDAHTLRWIGQFAERIAARCDTQFYGGLTLLTDVYLEQIRDHLADILDQPRPTAEEVEAKSAALAESNKETDTACGPLCAPRDAGGGRMPDRARYP